MENLIHIPSQKFYLGKLGIYSEEEVEYADKLEREWRKTQKQIPINQLLEIFPEAKKVLKKNTKEQVGFLQKKLDELLQIKRGESNNIKKPGDIHSLWAEETEQLMKEVKKKIKRLSFFLYFNDSKWEATDNRITEVQIATAKNVPIENFIELNRSGFAMCPFGEHIDKTPSFKVYKDKNRWHCFGCSQDGDVIDFYMKIQNKNFIETVKFLTNSL